MSMLDIFAIIVLVLLVVSAIVIVAVVGALPGRIARSRHHPHAEAVNIAGWVSLLFLPLWPLALVWAYVDVPRTASTAPAEADDLSRRVAALEATVHRREAAE